MLTVKNKLKGSTVVGKIKKRRPLRKVVMGLSIGTMLATICLLLPLSLSLLSTALSTAIQETMMKEGQSYAGTIDSWLAQQKYMVESIGEEIEASFTGDTGNLTDFLNKKALLPTNKETATIYVGLEDGRFFEAYGGGLAPGILCTERPWYQAAIASDETVITDPYEDVLYGGMVVGIAKKITVDGKVVGVIGADIRIDKIQDFIFNTENENGSYAFLINQNKDVLLHRGDYFKSDGSDYKNLDTITDNDYNKIGNMLQMNTDSTQKYTITDIDGEDKFVRVSNLNNAPWQVVVLAPTTNLTFYVNMLTIALVSLVIIASLIAIFVIRKVTATFFDPFETITAQLVALSNGDIYNKVDVRTNSLEVSQINDALSTTQDFLQKYISEISTVLANIAQGDLRVSLNNEYIGDFADIKRSLLAIISALNRTISGIQEASGQVSAFSEQVASGAQTLAYGTSEQAEAIQSLVNNLSRVSVQVTQNEHNTQQATVLAGDANKQVAQGSTEMAQMVSAMDNISYKSNQIRQIIKTIDDIAFQTNILALNAAIEAARAGAAGKGFAVVADEVRTLATKSAEAAQSTNQLIEDSILAVEKGSGIAKTTESYLTAIVQVTEQINRLVMDIATATGEQSASIGEINNSMAQISNIVQTNASTSEESAALGEELSSQAAILEELVLAFKIDQN